MAFLLLLFSEKSDSFDLFFLGQNGSASVPPTVTMQKNLTALSACFWVRFAAAWSTGTLFTLSTTGLSQNIIILILPFYVIHLFLYMYLSQETISFRTEWYEMYSRLGKQLM